MTHDEMIAVLEAARDGRAVESRPRFSEEQPRASRARPNWALLTALAASGAIWAVLIWIVMHL